MLARPTNALLTATLLCSMTGIAAAEDLPNLVIIVTDDQGIDAIEWPPNTALMQVHTPNLNAMAKQGVSFTNCRMNPNCSPTRAALMTGRYAIDTGVNGVLGRYWSPIASDPCHPDRTDLPEDVGKVTNRMALQHHERTIAEVLQSVGYYTVLIDKWHCGYNEAEEERGLLPHEQGFHEFFDWQDYICEGYSEGEFFADRHMTKMAQFAREAVARRGDKPYALFYHTITPHARHMDNTIGGGRAWWAIEDQSLVYWTGTWGDSKEARFVQNLEALDSVLYRDLLRQDNGRLGVLDGNRDYVAESNTIVIFTSDNGTDDRVSEFGEGRAKNSLFEGGIRVPLFVMGEGVPGNVGNPIMDDRQISHVDFYDTICDIVGATEAQRNNSLGSAVQYPRRSVSFAYPIGHRQTDEVRLFTCSSLGNADSGDQVFRVALVWDHWKLICNSDSNQGDGVYAVPTFDDMLNDEFYDLNLVTAKGDEDEDLLEGAMTVDQATAYYFMRDRLVDHWPSAVTVDASTVPAEYTVEHFAGQLAYVLVGHMVFDQTEQRYLYDDATEEFYDLGIDPYRTNNLVGQQMTPPQQAAYEAFREDLIELHNAGLASPDVALIDLPCVETLVANSDFETFNDGALTIGHEDVNGEDELEFRALLKFQIAGSIPDGFSLGDVLDAQIIVIIDSDSQEFEPDEYQANSYLSDDADTGVIEIFRQTQPWQTNYWSAHGATALGRFDPPPHIITVPFSEGERRKVRVLPMPSGTPISFGHSEDLKTLVQGWYNETIPNYGVLLKAYRLAPSELNPLLAGDQHLHFVRDAVLRLTLVRD